MKLFVKAADYGFTRGVTWGILDAIDYGIVRNAGLFTNMPSTEFAVSQMPARQQCCFGIEFNIVSGRPVADPALIPALVNEKGEFIRSSIRIKDPLYKTEDGRRELFPYDQTYREIRAQYDRFVELVGRKPGFLGGHSLGHEHYMEAIQQVSHEEGVPTLNYLHEHYHMASLPRYSVEGQANKQFNAMAQLEKDPEGHFWKYKEDLLKSEYAQMGGHMGYIDDELLGLTSLSLERCKDAYWAMSERVINWVRENNVELGRYDQI